MKKWFIVLALGGALTSCNESTTEQSGVLESALKALKNNQVSEFISYLMGPAKNSYGSAAGVEQLKRKLGSLNDLSIGNEKLTSSSNDSDGRSYNIYDIEILSRKNRLLTAEVRCTSVTTSHDYEECYDDTPVEPREPREPNPPRYHEPEPREPNPPRYHEPEPREPNPREPHEPREPNPPRYKGKSVINIMSTVTNIDMVRCHTRTSYSTSTTCKIADLK